MVNIPSPKPRPLAPATLSQLPGMQNQSRAFQLLWARDQYAGPVCHTDTLPVITSPVWHNAELVSWARACFRPHQSLPLSSLLSTTQNQQ